MQALAQKVFGLRWRARIILATALMLASAGLAAASPAATLAQAQSLVRAGKLTEAAELCRAELARTPEATELRRMLAWVMAWDHQYGTAESLWRELLAKEPGDHAAREGLATTLYWEGCPRAAAVEFRRVLEAAPGNAAARRQLMEIEHARRSTYTLDLTYQTDDQPYSSLRADLATSLLLDGGLRLGARVGLQALSADDAEALGLSRSSGQAPYVGASVEKDLLDRHLTLGGAVRILRYPEGDAEPLGGIAATLPMAGLHSRLRLNVERQELFQSATSLDETHYATDLGLRWELETPAGLLGAAGLRRTDYFDDNAGVAADGYILAPLRRLDGGDGRRLKVWVGASAAYRDTDETRYRVAATTATPGAGGGYTYRYEGVYDPYHTPQAQQEVRAVGAIEAELREWLRLKVHGDFGRGREDAVGFGPETGATPMPTGVGSGTFSRSYSPWRAGAGLSLALTPALHLRVGYQHSESAFYNADEVTTSLVGHF